MQTPSGEVLVSANTRIFRIIVNDKSEVLHSVVPGVITREMHVPKVKQDGKHSLREAWESGYCGEPKTWI